MSEKDIEQIRVAAYYLWENEGRPEGKSEEFWWKACQQMAKCGCKAVAKKSTAKRAVAKVAAKPVTKTTAKPVVKAAKAASFVPAVKAPAKKAAAAKKINPVPVKSAATKIITPLYGSIKK